MAALRVSVLGLYSYATEEFRAFREIDLPTLGPLLSGAELIIGFNIRRFDYGVLAPYLPFSLDRLPTLDLMDEVVNALGHRISLESLATATLGTNKQGSGLDAIRFFRAGEFEKLTAYCLHDVRLTRDLFDYGVRHGELFYHKAGQRCRFPVRWKVQASDMSPPPK